MGCMACIRRQKEFQKQNQNQKILKRTKKNERGVCPKAAQARAGPSPGIIPYNNSLISHSHDVEANIKISILRIKKEKTGDDARKIRGRNEAPFAATISVKIKRTSSGRRFRRTGQRLPPRQDILWGLEEVDFPLEGDPEGCREEHGILDVLLAEFLLNKLVTGSAVANGRRVVWEEGNHHIVDPKASFLPGSPQNGILISVIKKANHHRTWRVTFREGVSWNSVGPLNDKAGG